MEAKTLKTLMELYINKQLNIVRQCCITAIVSALLLGAVTTQADSSSHIAIIYPQVREPYSRIFEEIISGITETVPGPVQQYGITRETNIDEITGKLDEDGVSSVIMLGSRALKMLPTLSKNKKVLTGAIFSTPEPPPLKFSSISMIASPEVLLNQLTRLAPHVKTVHVIYHRAKDQWIIDFAHKVLKRKDITLNALPSDDVRTYARLYNELFKSRALSKTDALWLLQSDQSLKEPRVFATILENAWKQNFIVFSANPAHVRKGALFAMYPDNKKLGVSLANKMLSLRDGENHSIVPLKDLLVAVNIRTAEHLELDVSRSERESFNLVFPSR